MDFSAPQENEKPVEDQVMEFALKKMESYGFHKSRCSDALVKANHDVGKAFEDLMTELFELAYDIPQGKAGKISEHVYNISPYIYKMKLLHACELVNKKFTYIYMITNFIYFAELF